MHQDLTDYFTLVKRLNEADPNNEFLIANTKSQLQRLADKTRFAKVQNKITLVLMKSRGELSECN